LKKTIPLDTIEKEYFMDKIKLRPNWAAPIKFIIFAVVWQAHGAGLNTPQTLLTIANPLGIKENIEKP